MNKRTIIVVIVAAIIMLGVAFALTRDTSAPSATETDNNTPSSNTSDMTPQDSAADSSAPQTLIVYRNDGFVKTTLEIKAGQTITVRNDSDNTLDFASDEHPTHTKQPALNVGDIAPGQSKTFTINTPGTWSYHDHNNAAHTGTLIVQ